MIKYRAALLGLGTVLCLCALPEGLSAQSSRKTAKQEAEALSYQRADGARVDPNATIVRGASRSRLSPAEQMTFNLMQRRTELQEQIDLLGAELKTARGSRARKITRELDILADQLAVVERKLEALPKPQTIREAYSSGRPFRQFVDSLVDRRIEEEGYVLGTGGNSRTPTTDSYTGPGRNAAAEDFRITFRIQLGVTSRPNPQAYATLPGVKMYQRTDGQYAYYYGSYTDYAEAQSICKRLKANTKYRDAFVVALQGTQRIGIQEAVRLLAGDGSKE
ncbi:MAG: SPOR domain-containing protein [Rikenella sp.]|nr:SPOR domain-containing protein [Rikenella sp.]